MIIEDNVIDILKKAESAGASVLVAGGWGVDALLGRQTRQHNDFDIFVHKNDEKTLTEIFRSSGYQETEKHSDDNTAWTNADGALIDFHLFEFAEEGLMRHDGISFPADIFNGKGTIGGVAVRCMTAESQVSYRHGYELRDKDVQDVLLLCESFGLQIPEAFEITTMITPEEY